jgi:hypothetical protein
MTIIARAYLNHDEVGKSLCRKLAAIYPEGKIGESFRFELPDSDPRLRLILNHLTQAGLHAWLDVSRERTPDEYSLELERVYDAADLRATPYLVPHRDEHCPRFEDLSRTPEGWLKVGIGESEFGDPTGLGADLVATSRGLVVSSGLRNELESAGFLHLTFGPVVPFERGSDREWYLLPWAGLSDPYWELRSDLILPPLAPSCNVFSAYGDPVNGDFSKGCHMKEGLYRLAELHYTAAAIAEVEPFDVALTFERFDFATSRALPLTWIPVRIDSH